MKSFYLSLVLFLSVTVCFGQEESTNNLPITIVEEDADSIIYTYKDVDILPKYPGGEHLFQKSIYTKIVYPRIAAVKGTQGRVILQFIIEKDGWISNINILKDIGDGCGDEVVRVLKLTKDKWIPAMKNGEPVYKSAAIDIFHSDFNSHVII